MRHLFVELSHYTAQWLNLWMDAEDDEILEQLHQDWESTLSSGAETLDFYRTIKEQCPETVFHGTTWATSTTAPGPVTKTIWRSGAWRTRRTTA